MRYAHEQLALAYEIHQTYGWSWKRIGLFIGVAPHRLMQAVIRAEILGLSTGA